MAVCKPDLDMEVWGWMLLHVVMQHSGLSQHTPMLLCPLLQNNQLRWNRLENLLREGSKSSDFDASQLWLLANWLLSPNAEGIRHKLAVELARMLDATAAAQARERIAQRWVKHWSCSHDKETWFCQPQ